MSTDVSLFRKQKIGRPHSVIYPNRLSQDARLYQPRRNQSSLNPRRQVHPFRQVLQSQAEKENACRSVLLKNELPITLPVTKRTSSKMPKILLPCCTSARGDQCRPMFHWTALFSTQICGKTSSTRKNADENSPMPTFTYVSPVLWSIFPCSAPEI